MKKQPKDFDVVVCLKNKQQQVLWSLKRFIGHLNCNEKEILEILVDRLFVILYTLVPFFVTNIDLFQLLVLTFSFVRIYFC